MILYYTQTNSQTLLALIYEECQNKELLTFNSGVINNDLRDLFPIVCFTSFFLLTLLFSLHRTTGDERSPLLPTVLVVFELVFCLVFFSFPHWMMVVKYTHTEPPHTYIQTLGTEQYRGDFEVFLRRAACEGSQRAFTQTIYSRSWLVRWFCWRPRNVWPDRVCFWVPNRRSHNALQEQQQGEHWPEKFPWQLTVRERGFQGLDYRSGRHHDRKWKVKKRRVTLWHNQVCYFWFLSHISTDFFSLLFLTPLSSVLSRALCTLDRVNTHADIHWCVRSPAGLFADSK